MLKLTDFIAAIQSAIDSAAHLVAQKNFENLSAYFHQDGPAPATAPDSAAKGAPSPTDYAVLRPRMVAMVYPRDTPKGVVEHKVMVPLLSLAPMAYLQPEKINLEIDLEVLQDDNQVMIGFPHMKRTVFGRDAKPNAKLTMRINASTRPPGISAIIEGYDKSLRAQIPN